MRVDVGESALELVTGDITAQDTQAVVNAANERLAPGGGVAGAIHRAAGAQLWEECKALGGCRTGEAKLTKGYFLPNEYVIHTVGPVYSGKPADAELLASCYRESIRLAAEHGIKSVAFPALSTGIFGYPVEEAAPVALRTMKESMRRHRKVELVRLVLYNEETCAIHARVLEEMDGK